MSHECKHKSTLVDEDEIVGRFAEIFRSYVRGWTSLEELLREILSEEVIN